MFIYSPNDYSICLNNFYYILFTFYTRATAICTPTPIPKRGKMMIFLPNSKLIGNERDICGVTRLGQLYFKSLRYNKQVWFGNRGTIGT